MLETSEESVNHTLQHARAALGARLSAARQRAPLPHSAQERKLLVEFTHAFETGNAERVVALLTDDALLTVPARSFEYQGPATIGAFLANRFATFAGRRAYCRWTRANSQPAFGHYVDDPCRPAAHATGLIVLTLEGERIAGLTVFGDSALLRHFGLPPALPR